MFTLSPLRFTLCRRAPASFAGSRNLARSLPITSLSSSKHSRASSRMGKRKVQVDSDDELGLEPSDDVEEEKPKKKRQSGGSRKAAFTKPFVDKLGWNVEPPSLIWRSFGEPAGSAKIAAFDMDSTLVNRKSNAAFARDASDWKWWNKQTPAKLAELVEEGYKIVIFTNQGSIKGALDGKAKEKVEGMVEMMYKDLQKQADAEVPLQCFMAPAMTAGDSCRKPATGMWEFMVANCNDGIQPDLKASFFVGDADGSPQAHSNSDKKFAEAIGLDFKLPGDFFGPVDGKVAIDRDAVKAAQLAVESGDCPNSELVTQMKDLANIAFAASKAGGDTKLAFKGRAYMNAADSLATFPEKITESNLKAVNALKNVGKGTMDRIKQYLKAGTVKLPAELEEEAAAGGEGPTAAAKPTAEQQKAAFMFM